MKKGPLRLLLDTNILLDEYIPTRPSSVESRQLIGLALEQGHSLLYVGRAIVDVHYVISHTFKQMVREERGTVSEADALAIAEIAWGCVDNLSEMATAVGMDNGDVWLARKYRALHDDFEDNFVLAAAERADADFLITSDRQLLRKATIAALSPKDMLALLNATA